jgi:predicted nucleic acid-binding protein
LHAGPARRALAAEPLHAPHIVDAEVANTFRRLVGAGRVEADPAWRALDRWRRLGLTRYAVVGLLDRVWELRASVSAYDASYVALAEALDCRLVTADGRLGQAPGVRCPVTIVPR